MKFISLESTYLFHVLFLPLAVCLLYFNTLHAPFVLDDSQTFENNTRPIGEVSWESFRIKCLDNPQVANNDRFVL